MRRATAAAGAALLVAVGTPAAEAAPYLASCNSGVVAPQMCTFVASTVVAGFAAPGQYLVLTKLPTATAECADGGESRVEGYRGRLRGKAGVRAFTLTMSACPDEHPFVAAQTHTAHGYDYGVFVAVYPPASEDRLPRFDLHEGTFYGTTSSYATGELFRRHTGMSSHMAGDSYECDPGGRASNGHCELGAREYPYFAEVHSSISGHWARLQLEVKGEAKDVESRTAKVTAQPYGDGGWKITRVS